MSMNELQAALRALDEAADGHTASAAEVYAAARVLEAARRVAEGAGEPVAWRWPGGAWQDGDPSLTDKAQLKAAGVTPEFAYTTPPSADALVEALGKLGEKWRNRGRYIRGITAKLVREEIYMAADALEALIAKHKENTDVR